MIIAANWKMNLVSADAQKLADEMRDLAISHKNQDATAIGQGVDQGVDIVIFPPALHAPMVNHACDGAPLAWGGQSCHDAISGAYTGDISAAMFASAGASWQLVGHSERRAGHWEASHGEASHGESDAFIAAQLQASQNAGLTVVLCVGENQQEREAGNAVAVVTAQLAAACEGGVVWDGLVIAYEPVWAIGTGLVAALCDIDDMHQAIADYCITSLGAPQRPLILYGGSVNGTNAAQICGLAMVDGALVGGASLKVAEFAKIVELAKPVN